MIAAIAADHQRGPAQAFERVEHRLHEVLQVVRLLEDLDFLAQAGGARALILERGRGDGG